MTGCSDLPDWSRVQAAQTFDMWMPPVALLCNPWWTMQMGRNPKGPQKGDLAVWVVDTMQDVASAVKFEVGSVISNRPFEIRAEMDKVATAMGCHGLIGQEIPPYLTGN